MTGGSGNTHFEGPGTHTLSPVSSGNTIPKSAAGSGSGRARPTQSPASPPRDRSVSSPSAISATSAVRPPRARRFQRSTFPSQETLSRHRTRAHAPVQRNHSHPCSYYHERTPNAPKLPPRSPTARLVEKRHAQNEPNRSHQQTPNTAQKPRLRSPTRIPY